MSNLLAAGPRSAVLCPAPERVAEIALGAPVANCEWNFQTDVWEWEAALFDVYGVQAQHFVPSGPSLLGLKHPDDLATVQVFMEAIRRRGTGFSYSHRIFRDDGYVRHINTAGRVSFGADGVPGLMRATVDVLGEWESPLSQVDLATASDGVLMLALRAQIPEAVAEAFRRHGAGVLRVARCFIHASLSADDIVQDVFEALLSSAGRFDARRGSLATYLKMQTRTRCIDLGRSHASRRTRELFYERADLAPPSEDVALSALAAVGVRGALEHLPPDERIPIELAYLGGICYRAVAEQLGLPEGTVKSRIRRGLLRLRESSNVL